MKLCGSFGWKRLNNVLQAPIPFGQRHLYRSSTSLQLDPSSPTKSKKVGSPKKKYSDTVILPKSDFPLKISQENRKEHELALAVRLKFDKLYASQLQWRRDQPEYILHDGPPYANGEAHIGHAVNKILKDITNRYKLLRGYRINYRPGWDCHGLPIELKSTKEKLAIGVNPNGVRGASRDVANEAILEQKQAFQRWAVIGDWENPYKTFDKDYVKAQLQLFHLLYDKGLLYRDLKPVYWSPSSHTALAEAELEYVSNHESTSILLNLDLSLNLGQFMSEIGSIVPAQFDNVLDKKVFAVIWTTTPWTLPSNTAVAYCADEKYSVLYNGRIPANRRDFYIVATKLIPLFESLLEKNMEILTEFSGDRLKNLTYQHPWFEDRRQPFLDSSHVTMDKGTGLVHIAPAHGPDDFLLALKHNLPIECFVDDEGKFDSRLGALKGLPALTMGNTQVLKKLEESVIYNDTKFVHSYPYDWRTKKPVLVKASMQWFLNTQKLKEKAVELLANVNIFPKNIQNGMAAQVMSRPYWCISRQRLWGVPIPVLYNKETGEPVVSKKIIDKMCEVCDRNGNLDSWWTLPPSAFSDNKEADTLYEKGKDIFDIWFDSGISWHLLDGKTADLCVEGLDQFTGWFQSSLLLSLAVRGTAPYKNLLVHGFVVDEDNKKMSKSLGNVVHPTSVTDGDKALTNGKAFGVDVLRWWVASQGSQGSSMALSTTALRSAEENIQKLRHVLKFLVSFTNEKANEDLDVDEVTYDELEYMDQYMLLLLNKFQKEVTEQYEGFAYHRVMMKVVHFVTVHVSAHYLTWVKDRLYCDRKDSQSRKSAMYVLNQIYLTLIKTLGPVLPFLTEESYSYYSAVEESLFKYTWFNVGEEQWDNGHVNDLFALALDIRTSLNHVIGENDQKQVWVEIICNQSNFKMLQVLHPDECNSELCDILQVSGVTLHCSDQADFSINPYGVSHSLNGFSVGVSKTEKMQCARCRRFCCTEGDVLCSRCAAILKVTTIGTPIEQQQRVVEVPEVVEDSQQPPAEIRSRT